MKNTHSVIETLNSQMGLPRSPPVVMVTMALNPALHMHINLDQITCDVEINTDFIRSVVFRIHVNTSSGICNQSEFIQSGENLYM